MKHTLSGWSKDAKEIITYAVKWAHHYVAKNIGVESLFFSIINIEEFKENSQRPCIEALEHFGINHEDVILEISKVAMLNINYITMQYLDTFAANPSANPRSLSLTKQAEHIITLSSLNISLLPISKLIEPVHVFLSIVQDETNIPSNILHNLGITYKNLLAYFLEKYFNSKKSLKDNKIYNNTIILETSLSNKKSNYFKNNVQDTPNNNISTTKLKVKKTDNTPILDNFSKDLTLLAMRGELDPVIGRDNEINRIIQILGRKNKNNPIIIGEPGVGKTVIVEGLAIKIIECKVPLILENKRIISLNVNSLVAGTQYRGQFEERLKDIMLELERSNDIILFIDEIHTIVGAGGVHDTLDLSEIIKPKLARGEFRCIGSTTLAEYRTSIEANGALKRRFQKVMVYPPTTKETINILYNIKDRYESFHNVSYTDEAIEACVNLSERYISDRFLPDKAIDIMDEAGAKYQLNIQYPQTINNIHNQIKLLLQQVNQNIKSKNYTKTKILKNKIYDLNNQAQELKEKWLKTQKKQNPIIDVADINNIVSQMTGIPLDKIDENEHRSLQNMHEVLKQSVVGQDRAIDILCRALRSSKLGFKDPDRPIGSFLFLGATGVGKTELAKSLASNFFHRQDALIRVDMSEHMERFSITRLIGAPPGFVGHEKGGSLSEKVRHNPYSVVLFDEIEKAHPDIYNLLLQILDEGMLTDSFGNNINFCNTIIIMTSNVGIREFQDFGPGVGFKTQNRKSEEHKFFEQHIQQALKKKFAPEFLNRIDEIIVFNHLNFDSLMAILNIQLAKFNRHLAKNHINIQLSLPAKEFICQKSYNQQYGARPLRRTIQKEIEDILVDFLLENTLIPTQDKPLNLIIDTNNTLGQKLKISILKPEVNLV